MLHRVCLAHVHRERGIRRARGRHMPVQTRLLTGWIVALSMTFSVVLGACKTHSGESSPTPHHPPGQQEEPVCQVDGTGVAIPESPPATCPPYEPAPIKDPSAFRSAGMGDVDNGFESDD